MGQALSEITFVGMSPRVPKEGKASPSAENMPGWKLMADAIRDAVETSGVPVDVIAERAGLSRQYVYTMMAGSCNPSMERIEAVMDAAGASLEHWIFDKATYGRDKRLHDQIQLILNQRGTNAVALRTTVEALISLSARDNSK